MSGEKKYFNDALIFRGGGFYRAYNTGDAALLSFEKSNKRISCLPF